MSSEVEKAEAEYELRLSEYEEALGRNASRGEVAAKKMVADNALARLNNAIRKAAQGKR